MEFCTKFILIFNVQLTVEVTDSEHLIWHFVFTLNMSLHMIKGKITPLHKIQCCITLMCILGFALRWDGYI